jgi:hypothetical protein
MKAYLWKTFAKDNRIRGTKNEKGEAAYLLGVSSSSVKRYARMVPFIVNLGQGRPT